jgi:hypothetical protein
MIALADLAGVDSAALAFDMDFDPATGRWTWSDDSGTWAIAPA